MRGLGNLCRVHALALARCSRSGPLLVHLSPTRASHDSPRFQLCGRLRVQGSKGTSSADPFTSCPLLVHWNLHLLYIASLVDISSCTEVRAFLSFASTSQPSSQPLFLSNRQTRARNTSKRQNGQLSSAMTESCPLPAARRALARLSDQMWTRWESYPFRPAGLGSTGRANDELEMLFANNKL